MCAESGVKHPRFSDGAHHSSESAKLDDPTEKYGATMVPQSVEEPSRPHAVNKDELEAFLLHIHT